MSGQKTIKVVIHGIEFSVRTDDPEYINKIAGFVDEQIDKIVASGKVSALNKAVMLAAFNIADELFRLRRERDEVSKKVSERLDAMLEMTEGASPITEASDRP